MNAKKFMKDNDVKYVLAQFVDIHGSAKAKAVPAEHLDMVLTDGAGFAGFAVWGLGMGPHGPDFMAVGDAATLTSVPWMPGYARIACDGHVKGKKWLATLYPIQDNNWEVHDHPDPTNLFITGQVGCNRKMPPGPDAKSFQTKDCLAYQ